MKRSFEEIRNKILTTLTSSKITKMEIARNIDADYRTVERHLIWLIGTDKIKRVEKDKKVYYKLK
ncbi:MAG: hypothetical protein ISS48_01400 [Candidatus Aenigmarchaeota archaeon]|nr:hypothetical protein [Candidatus Aenigmarchaeota archaeon]